MFTSDSQCTSINLKNQEYMLHCVNGLRNGSGVNVNGKKQHLLWNKHLPH